LEQRQVVEVLGLRFYVGVLRGQNVVVVAGGIGTVNAGVATAVLLTHFQPQAVIFTGVAGGLGQAVTGDVVIGTKAILYGYGEWSEQGYQPRQTQNPVEADADNPLYFDADPNLLAVAQAAAKTVVLPPLACYQPEYTPKFLTGIIATEDVYSISSERNERMLAEVGCVAFEMEGAAAAQICYQQRVPCLLIRAISNPANELGTAENVYRRCKAETARNAQLLVLAMMEKW
jgi:adenosylhomocysteine nucleosidase